MSAVPKIEVFEAGSDEEMLMMAMLGQAKHMHEDHPHGVQPHGFVFGEARRLVVVGFGNFGDYNQPRVRDMIAEAVRDIAKEERADFIGFISDVWQTAFEKIDEIEAEGLDPMQYRTWSEEAKRRHPFVRREALLLSMETRVGHKYLSQFYRRAGGKIVWEEIRVEDPEATESGRFANLLPRGD